MWDVYNNHKEFLDLLAPIYWDTTTLEKFTIKEYLGTEMRIIDKVTIEPSANHNLLRIRMIMYYDLDFNVCDQLACASKR